MGRHFKGKSSLTGIILLLIVNTAMTQKKPDCVAMDYDENGFGSTVFCEALHSMDTINLLAPEAKGIDHLMIDGSRDLVLTPEHFRRPVFSNLSQLTLTGLNFSSVDAALFSGIANLQGLRLEGFQIMELNSGSFTGLENLTEVGVLSNTVEMIISSDTFRNFTKLRYLSLMNNGMKTVPRDLLKGLEMLIQVDFSGNRLTRVDNDMFQGAPNLESIHLNQNCIVTIEPGSFTNLRELSGLVLESNKLHNMEAGLFVNNKKLTYLDLTRNNLTDLSNYHLNSSSLVFLKMNEGGIENIPLHFFSNLPNLEGVYLINNNITQLRPGMFDGFPNRKFIKLDSNQLTTISVDTMKELHDLVKPTRIYEGLTLKNNNFDCDSDSMRSTREYCIENGIGFFDLFNCPKE